MKNRQIHNKRLSRKLQQMTQGGDSQESGYPSDLDSTADILHIVYPDEPGQNIWDDEVPPAPENSGERRTRSDRRLFPAPIRNQLQPFFSRYKKLIASVTLVVWLFSILFAVFGYTPRYQSQSAVMIKDSAITGKIITEDPISTTSSSSANPVLNTMELLKSDVVMTALWEEFIRPMPVDKRPGKVKDVNEWAYVYGDGKKFISFKNLPGTDVINLTFSWDDPVLARKGMKVVLDAFQAASRTMNQSEHHERYIYLSKQVEGVRTELETIRTKITDYKVKHGTNDVSKEIESYTKNRIEFEIATITANAESQGYQGQLNAYKKSLGMNTNDAVHAVALGRNQSLSKLYDQYYTLSEQYNSLKTRYRDEHPQIKQVKAQMEQTYQDILKESQRMGTSVKNPDTSKAIADETRGNAVRDMLDVNAKSQGSDIRAKALRSYLNKLENRMKTLPDLEENLSNMEDQEKSLSDSLKTLESKVIDAKIREAQTLSNVFIIDSPSAPHNASFPTQFHIIVLGLLLGLAAGVAIAFLNQEFVQEVATQSEYNRLRPAHEDAPRHYGLNITPRNRPH